MKRKFECIELDPEVSIYWPCREKTCPSRSYSVQIKKLLSLIVLEISDRIQNNLANGHQVGGGSWSRKK